MYLEPSKTITAPYSQANELVFRQSSGQQCVAVSLCSLINNNKPGINPANDEYRKSVVFKFVSVNQTIIFNADRIAHTFKCVRD